MNDKTIKVSLLGDITLDRPMLYCGKTKDGTYDYSGTFDELSQVLSDSDCVIGNLETQFAGEGVGYNPGVVSYNSPDAFLKEIRKLSPKLVVTTANNHCLDMGLSGVKRTLKMLDQNNIHHTGVFVGAEKRYIVLNLTWIKVAILSFTSVINNRENGLPHSYEELSHINCLFSEESKSTLSIQQKIKRFIPFHFIRKLAANIRRKRSGTILKPFSDEYDIPDSDLEALDRATQLLRDAKANSDVVISCVHSGGQFNEKPGKYTVQLFELLGKESDFIVGNHPHVVQGISRSPSKLCAYSLGSVNLSPSADYIVPGTLSDYSLILHLYFRPDECGEAVCERITFSVLKSVEDEHHFTRIVPVWKLYEKATADQKTLILKDVRCIYNRCQRGEYGFPGILSEYEIP